MASRVKIDLKPLERPKGGDVVVFVGEDLSIPAQIGRILGRRLDETVRRAAAAERFKGRYKTALVVSAPQHVAADRLIVVGTGKGDDRKKVDWIALGGFIMGKLTAGRVAHILIDVPGEPPADPAACADIALGLTLRGYRFDLYKTKKKDDSDESGAPARITLHVPEPSDARKALRKRLAIGGGVLLARDLVNEPPNVLHPEEFADRAKALAKLDVQVDILDEKQMKKLGMRALLGVGQGSRRESRLVVMRWNGGKPSERPVAIIGKGVCFDTGGISIKPAGGMEDMKGDMAGAACVVGLMQALATRQAAANVVGTIGLVENMPDGGAQRPGDIVTSMSGQTIEIINTDAEGRLVLCDALHYVRERFKPQFMIDLATLTGAIMVALGQEHAGLFSNNDTLADRLIAAGKATGELVWRMPLGKAYDKLIDSKFADVKNTGGRHAGSITAAQFLQRFVGDTPWAHLDIAGTGMGSPHSDINRSWGSGWGVRLLDRLISDHYEN
jgi:leucyl aminopeptidase